MEIVFTESSLPGVEPFTTSLIISKYAEVKHHSVTWLIGKYKERLESTGVVRVELDKPTEGSLGCRPIKYFKLNEVQATFIITLLKNTPKVVSFKEELSKQFFIMKQELMKRQIIREMEKPVRKELTDTIKEYMPDDKWAYGNVTRLLCKTVTNYNPKQLKEIRNAMNGHSLMDILTSEEFEGYQSLEQKVITLIEFGMDYQEIKEIINRKE